MPEYIDRQKAKDELLAWAACIQRPQYLRSEDAMCVLDGIPAADVEPVVRCRDCRKFKTYGCRMVASGYDDFCSYGERKEDAT